MSIAVAPGSNHCDEAVIASIFDKSLTSQMPSNVGKTEDVYVHVWKFGMGMG